MSRKPVCRDRFPGRPPRRPSAAAALAVLVLSLLVAGCGGDGGAVRDDDRPNLLLVTVDTLRADVLGCYGAETGASPAIDALAARGVRVERSWSVTPLTTPAHATLLTGTYPGTHGVRNNGRFRLPDGATTLAEVLAAEGYRTGAVVGAFPVQRMFGFGQGFDHFDEDFGTDFQGRKASQRRADAVNRRALAWLASVAEGGQPWFLWVHYYDPHEPYDAPEPYASAHPGRPYDGEVAFTDKAVGDLLADLDRRGLTADTVVALTADHGEGLGDHGESTHGVLLYEPMIRVPLVVAAPGRLPEGVTSPVALSGADVMPTLLGLLDLTPPEGVQGEDLSSALVEEGGAPRALYAETFYPQDEFGWSPLRAMRLGAHKVILGPETEWFDLDADPSEAIDRAGEDPETLESLVRRLRDMGKAHERAALGGEAADMGDAALDSLAGLGYVGGGGGAAGDPWDLSGRQPREAIADYEAFMQATQMIQQGRAADAVPVMAELASRDPDNPQFLFKLAQARIRGGAEARGEADLLALIGRHPTYYLAYRELSSVYERQERYEEALGVWDRLDETGAVYVGADLRRARVLIRLGRDAEARRLLADHLRDSPDDAEASRLLAEIEARSGESGPAEARLRDVIRRSPSDVEALKALAELLIRERRFAEALPLLDQGLSTAPSNGEIRSQRALVLARLGRVPEAVEEARGAVMLDPASISLQQNLGAILLEAGRLEEALGTFEAILGRDPAFLPALISRGIVKLQQGNPAGAAADFRAVLERDPGNPAATHFLGRIEGSR